MSQSTSRPSRNRMEDMTEDSTFPIPIQWSIQTAAWNKNESSRSNVGEVKASRRSNNVPVTMGDYLCSPSQKENVATREPTTTYMCKNNRMHYSGPLMPPGGSIEDMMKDHEGRIQEAVRSPLEKSATKKDKDISVKACA